MGQLPHGETAGGIRAGVQIWGRMAAVENFYMAELRCL